MTESSWVRPFGWRYDERTKFCFAPCPPEICDCMESTELCFNEAAYEREILNCPLTVDNLERLIDITRNEEHDVYRALAKCRLEGAVVSIIESLINHELVDAATALVADVKRRHPGEELFCPYMKALDESLRLRKEHQRD